ncbi:MAG: hypothetical protein M1336_00550 [Deltaproteobacteria bacterium]|jgi:hypothetical protein|nr:hypothetical protein [Deltaproteobacteria bacterium]
MNKVSQGGPARKQQRSAGWKTMMCGRLMGPALALMLLSGCATIPTHPTQGQVEELTREVARQERIARLDGSLDPYPKGLKEYQTGLADYDAHRYHDAYEHLWEARRYFRQSRSAAWMHTFLFGSGGLAP